MDQDIKFRVIEKLVQLEKRDLEEYNVVLMPDFFADHFLTMDSFENQINRIKTIYEQGGGNVPGVSQKICQGGNAANTALALSQLGVNVYLICRTDDLGLHLLKFFLGKHGVNLDGAKTDGKLAVTTAMEFDENHVNVMIGDTGSVSDFSFDSLNESDLEKISNSDLVGVMNWTLNNCGSDLASGVFDFARRHNTKTFFDSGDPEHRKKDISELFECVLCSSNLDILGINENELRHFNPDFIISNDEDIISSAVSLKNKISARLDLHTSNFSVSVNDNHTIVPTISLQNIYRSTGAGDAWNAGNIFGDLLGFNDYERLLLANSTAGRYISSPQPVHPNLEEIVDFLQKI